MKKVLVAGELNVDIVLQGYHAFPEPGKEVLVDDFVMVLGSASAICAMGLARLGVPVAFLGKAGDDPWGRFCIDCLTGRGIDVTARELRARAQDRGDGRDHLAARSRARLLPGLDRGPPRAR